MEKGNSSIIIILFKEVVFLTDKTEVKVINLDLFIDTGVFPKPKQDILGKSCKLLYCKLYSQYLITTPFQ